MIPHALSRLLVTQPALIGSWDCDGVLIMCEVFTERYRRCVAPSEHRFCCLCSVCQSALEWCTRLQVAISHWSTIRGGADKSLARPGRKQATATKLGIYATYSSRSSIHFLARCSNFCKPLKKKSEGCPSNQVSAAEYSDVHISYL